MRLTLHGLPQFLGKRAQILRLGRIGEQALLASNSSNLSIRPLLTPNSNSFSPTLTNISFSRIPSDSPASTASLLFPAIARPPDFFNAQTRSRNTANTNSKANNHCTTSAEVTNLALDLGAAGISSAQAADTIPIAKISLARACTVINQLSNPLRRADNIG